MNESSCHNPFIVKSKNIQQNSKRVQAVLAINLAVMILEIYFGYKSGSMSLLADGWHMGTHAAALMIAVIAYKLATDEKMTKNFNFGGGKIISLGGFASSLFLFGIAIFVSIEATERIFKPLPIGFDEAFLVAVIGLLVNIAGAFLLRPQDLALIGESDTLHQHHLHSGHHSHRDHNIHAAYIHILADALTSIGAIIAILAAKYFSIQFLDPLVAIISSFVILKWAYKLLKDTSWELLDGHAKSVDFESLRRRLLNENVSIIDLHVWQVGPGQLSAELVVKTAHKKGLHVYRQILEKEFGICHSVIEERD